MKLFATDLPDEQLKELRGVIARFLIEKGRDQADAIWDERGYDEDTVSDSVLKRAKISKHQL